MSETTTTTTISDFLLARIAEDEAVASEDVELTIWGKRPNLEQSLYTWGNDYGGGFGITQSRVLAECEAKRQIVELHSPRGHALNGRINQFTGKPHNLGLVCDECSGYDDPHIDQVCYPCGTIRALVSVYADHPDYDQSWRP